MESKTFYRNKAEISMAAYKKGNPSYFDQDTLFELIYIEDVPCLTPVDDDDDTLLEYRDYKDLFYEVDNPIKN